MSVLHVLAKLNQRKYKRNFTAIGDVFYLNCSVNILKNAIFQLCPEIDCRKFFNVLRNKLYYLNNCEPIYSKIQQKGIAAILTGCQLVLETFSVGQPKGN